jgi:TIR domain
MSHVFISYVHEDSADVERIVFHLRSAGVAVWIDRENIPPGARWKDTIRDGIRKGTFFVPCFSKAYLDRARTYMNEELAIAVEELRLRPRSRTWFLPVSLDGSDVPELPIGPGETLLDLQTTRLNHSWEQGITRLISVIVPHSPRLGTVNSGFELRAALKAITNRGATHLVDDLIRIKSSTEMDDETLDDLGLAVLRLSQEPKFKAEVLSWEQLCRLPNCIAALTSTDRNLLIALESLTSHRPEAGRRPSASGNAFALLSSNEQLFHSFAAYFLDGFDRLKARYEANCKSVFDDPYRVRPSQLMFALGLVARALGHRTGWAPILDIGEKLIIKVVDVAGPYANIRAENALALLSTMVPSQAIIDVARRMGDESLDIHPTPIRNRTIRSVVLERMGQPQDDQVFVDILTPPPTFIGYSELFASVILARRGVFAPLAPVLSEYGMTAKELADLTFPEESVFLQPISERLVPDWDERAQLFEGLFYSEIDLTSTWASHFSYPIRNTWWWRRIWNP